MKKYFAPTLEMIVASEIDVLTGSNGSVITGPIVAYPNETPDVPLV